MIDLTKNRQSSMDGLDIYEGLKEAVGQRVKARFVEYSLTDPEDNPIPSGDIEFNLLAMYGDKPQTQTSASDCLIQIDDDRYPVYKGVILALYSNGVNECLKVLTADPNEIKQLYGDQFTTFHFENLDIQSNIARNFCGIDRYDD